jgi:hypothetical protein
MGVVKKPLVLRGLGRRKDTRSGDIRAKDSE